MRWLPPQHRLLQTLRQEIVARSFEGEGQTGSCTLTQLLLDTTTRVLKRRPSWRPARLAAAI